MYKPALDQRLDDLGRAQTRQLERARQAEIERKNLFERDRGRGGYSD